MMTSSIVATPLAAGFFAGPVSGGAVTTPHSIINAFNAPQRQFGEQYDASAHAAVIKMLMVTFGPSPSAVFDEVKRVFNGYAVVLKDNHKVHVSDQELQRTAAASRFAGADGVTVSNANFVLAVFIKRKQLSIAGAGRRPTFETALSRSMHGETPLNLLKGLGVAGFARLVPSQHVEAKGGLGVMETHTFGACVVYEGRVYDPERARPLDRPYLYRLSNAKAPDDGRESTPVPVRLLHVVGDLGGTSPLAELTADFSTGKKGEKPADIVSAFDVVERRFGERFDTRHHAAVIKMMMMEFGQSPLHMFEKVVPDGDGYRITMKDGYEVHLSKEALKQTAGVSRFTGTDKWAVKDANFMLAAYLKRKQRPGAQTNTPQLFERTLSNTLTSDTAYQVLKGLGMIGVLRIVGPATLQQKGVVAVVHGFFGELVLDGMKHHDGKQQPVGNDYGYRLARQIPDNSPPNAARPLTHLSQMPVGAKPDSVWGGFYQGVQRNCVTVSAIKAAMMKYGQSPLGIYTKISETPDGYTVTLRDACVVRLTYDELKQAQHGANFHGNDQGLLSDAIFLYAVSAKRAQMENHEFRAGASFEAAMGTLNDGESPGEALRRLGLYAFTRHSSARELASGVPGTLSNFSHSVVVFDGYLDLYGARVKLAGTDWMRSAQALKLV